MQHYRTSCPAAPCHVNPTTIQTSSKELRTLPLRYWMLLLLASLNTAGLSSQAQTTSFFYQFSGAAGTYSAISGGTQHFSSYDTDGVVNVSFTGGFTFNFNGTNYSAVNISNNGFITFGATAPTANTYNPIVVNTGYAGAIAGYALNLNNSTVTVPAGVRSQLLGTAPAREFVVQYQNAARNGLSASDVINFQIRLHEDGTIRIVYGDFFTTQTTVAPGFGMVGLRGATNADFNTRMVTAGVSPYSTWASSGGGSDNGAFATVSNSANGGPNVVSFTPTCRPTSGYTFTFARRTQVGLYQSLPYTQNFDAEPWSNLNSVGDQPGAGVVIWPATGNRSWRRQNELPANSWFTSTNGLPTAPQTQAGTGAARFNQADASTGLTGNLDIHLDFSPVGDKVLSFWMRNPGTADANDVMRLFLSTDGGNNFTQIGNNYAAPIANWTQFTAFLGSSTASNAVLRFQGVSDRGSVNEDLLIDEISVTIAACSSPTILAATSVGTNSAQANWTGGTGSYIVEYGPTGFLPGSGTTAGSASSQVLTAAAGTSQIQLTGLLANTTYQYYIRQVCGTNDVSFNSPAQSFTTLFPRRIDNVTASHPSTNPVLVGTANNEIIRVLLQASGNAGSITLDQLRVRSGNTSDADIAVNGVKLYNTTATTVLSPANLIGTTSFSGGVAIFTGLAQTLDNTTSLTVSYDVVSAAAAGNTLDASIDIGGLTFATTGAALAPGTQPTTALNPTGNRQVRAVLNGTYRVGTAAGSNFPTITAALTELNLMGVSGPVRFELVSSSYNAGETFPIVINPFTGASSTNRLTIVPAANVNATISGSTSSNTIIRINGADFVTIDGSNNNSTSRNLTISNTSSTSSGGIAILSAGLGAGSTDIIVRNLNISSSSTSGTTNFGIAICGASLNAEGSDNDNVTIENNNINNMLIGISALGTATTNAGGLNNLVIRGNTVTFISTSNSGSPIGIRVGNALGASIAKNTINLRGTDASAPVGIQAQAGFLGGVIDGNHIVQVQHRGGGRVGGFGITVGTGSTNSSVVVSNNMIRGVNGNNNSTFTATPFSTAGLLIGGTDASTSITTGGVRVYYNTIALDSTHNQNFANVTTALLVGSNASALDIRNNIFVNRISNTNPTLGLSSRAYAIYSLAASSAFSTINNNLYQVTSGSQGVLGFIGGSDRTTLAAIQSSFGGNTNSVVATPVFVSPVDLRVVSSNATNIQALDGKAVAIAAVTTDFDNEPRNATTPDIGADEFSSIACVNTVGGTITATASGICTGTAVTFSNSGASTAQGTGYQWEVSTTSGTGFAAVTSGTGGTTLSYTTATNLAAGTYFFRLRVTCPSQTDAFSNQLQLNVGSLLSGTAATNNGPVCVGQTINLNVSGVPATPGITYAWTGPSGFTATAAAPSRPNATSTMGGSYNVVITNNGCVNPTLSTTVVVNVPITTPLITPASAIVCANGNALALTATSNGSALPAQTQVTWAPLTGLFTNAAGTVAYTGDARATVFARPTSNTTYTASITVGACATVTASSTLTVLNQWTGAASTAWSNPANWSCGVPDVSTPLQVNLTTNQPVLDANVTVGSITMAANTNISLNGNQFTVNGPITGTGTFNSTATSSLVLGGNASLAFNSGNNTLRGLTVTAGNVTLTNALNMVGAAGAANGEVIVNAGAVLNANGNLTLRSTASGTARVGISAGTINGNVTVERFISDNNGNRAWRMLSVPTRGSQTFKQAWQEGATSITQNPIPGYGTILTAGTGNLQWQANGYDARQTSGSLLRYATNFNGWAEVISTNSAMETEMGYFLFVRGDRSVLPSTGTTAAINTTLRTTGTLYQGNQAARSVANNTFALVGNIYASAIDFTGLTRTGGMTNQFWVWDPKLSLGGSLGAYQAFSGTIPFNFVPLIPGGSYPTGVPNTVIESGQAFFVYARSAPGSIALNESAKTAGVNLPFRPLNGSAIPTLRTFVHGVSGSSTTYLADVNYVAFDPSFSNAVDENDVVKFTNTNENVAVRRDNVDLLVESRQPVQNNDSILINMWNMRPQTYRFTFEPQHMNTISATAMLVDRFTNTNTPISLTQNTTVDFTVTSNPASANQDRFRILFNVGAPIPVTFTNVSAYSRNGGIQVDWKVAAELNINRYQVERSTDGRNFTTAGTVAATGNTGGEVNYGWFDPNPTPGTHFFRIRSIGNAAGDVKLTQVVRVVIGGDQTPAVTVAPNPIQGNTMNVQFRNLTGGRYNLRLMNAAGQVMYTNIAELVGGNSTMTYRLPVVITAGTYTLEVLGSDRKTRFTQTIIINTNN